MFVTLIAVDGSESSRRAAEHVARLAQAGLKSEVHVLNVQIPVDSGHVRMFVEGDQIDAYYREEGLAALAPACDALGVAELPYIRHVAVGHVADTIARYAERLAAAQIVMGSGGGDALRHTVLGSVARDVAAHSKIPVTLVC